MATKPVFYDYEKIAVVETKTVMQAAIRTSESAALWKKGEREGQARRKAKAHRVASGRYFVEECSQTRTLAANFPLERQELKAKVCLICMKTSSGTTCQPSKRYMYHIAIL